MAAAFALAIFSGKIIFIFANLENLRIFQICFFTEKVVTINGICRAGFLWERSCSRKGATLSGWLKMALVNKPKFFRQNCAHR
jgi:hypothetical protein